MELVFWSVLFGWLVFVCLLFKMLRNIRRYFHCIYNTKNVQFLYKQMPSPSSCQTTDAHVALDQHHKSQLACLLHSIPYKDDCRTWLALKCLWELDQTHNTLLTNILQNSLNRKPRKEQAGNNKTWHMLTWNGKIFLISYSHLDNKLGPIPQA